MKLKNKFGFDPLLLAIVTLFVLIFCNINGFLALVFNRKSLVTVLLLGLSIFIPYYAIFIKRLNIKFKPFLFFLFFMLWYIGYTTLTYLWNPEFLHQATSLVKIYRNYFSTILVVSAFYIGTVYMISRKGRDWMTKLLLGLSLFTVSMILIGPSIGITSAYTSVSRDILVGDRDAGLFGNPNEAGILANYSLVIVLAAFSYFRKYKIWFLLLSIIPITAAISTFSKAAIIMILGVLALFGVVNIFGMFKIGRSNLRYLVVFLGLIFMSTLWLTVNFDSVLDGLAKNQKRRIIAITKIAGGQINKKTTSHRSVVFSYAADRIVDRPILGHGIGSFHRLNGGELQLGVHNTFLMLAGEGGLITLLLFLGFFASLYYQSLLVHSQGLKFLLMGIFTVFLFAKCMFGHTALQDRVSNGLLGISMAVLFTARSQKKIKLYE